MLIFHPFIKHGVYRCVCYNEDAINWAKMNILKWDAKKERLLQKVLTASISANTIFFVAISFLILALSP